MKWQRPTGAIFDFGIQKTLIATIAQNFHVFANQTNYPAFGANLMTDLRLFKLCRF